MTTLSSLILFFLVIVLVVVITALVYQNRNPSSTLDPRHAEVFVIVLIIVVVLVLGAHLLTNDDSPEPTVRDTLNNKEQKAHLNERHTLLRQLEDYGDQMEDAIKKGDLERYEKVERDFTHLVEQFEAVN
ncbi:hypothetical protein [Paenibacillus glucanolyticus]|uniref:hypothetical protein n=1 Tax=Paenibacillus glucanolyticus TaxID=59843 RepID=UPI00096F8198|nr:hypothetical protein [Paenibacillus glucanolyticus]OMF76667.1 hypothetical protein BK142_14175 [Paenibacillus glucanolyticus]